MSWKDSSEDEVVHIVLDNLYNSEKQDGYFHSFCLGLWSEGDNDKEEIVLSNKVFTLARDIMEEEGLIEVSDRTKWYIKSLTPFGHKIAASGGWAGYREGEKLQAIQENRDLLNEREQRQLDIDLKRWQWQYRWWYLIFAIIGGGAGIASALQVFFHLFWSE